MSALPGFVQLSRGTMSLKDFTRVHIKDGQPQPQPSCALPASDAHIDTFVKKYRYRCIAGE